MVPEGIEARVTYKGDLKTILNAMLVDIHKKMAQLGETKIDDLVNHEHIARDSEVFDFEAATDKQSLLLLPNSNYHCK